MLSAAELVTKRPSRSRFVLLFVGAVSIAGLSGFWPAYFGPLLARGEVQEVMRSWTIPGHAAYFALWLIGVFVQVSLVRRRRIDLHRRFGNVLIWYGLIGVVVGLTVALVMASRRVSLGGAIDEEAPYLLLPLFDMVMFPSFLITGYVLRNRKASHMRLMLLAFLVIAMVGYGRLVGWVTPAGWLDARWLATILYLAPLEILIAQDLWASRKLHTVYAIAIPVFLVKVNQDLVMQTEAWRRLSVQLLLPFVN